MSKDNRGGAETEKVVGVSEFVRKEALLEFLNGIYTNSRYEQFVIDCMIEKINTL